MADAATRPLGLLALIVPCALIWVSYDQQTRQALETRLFTELADGQERVSGRSSDASARVVLTAAARLFGGDAEMVLMTADGPVRYVGDDRNVLRQRVDQEVFSEAWVVRALGSRAVTTGVEDGRPVLLDRPRRPRSADGGPGRPAPCRSPGASTVASRRWPAS